MRNLLPITPPAVGRLSLDRTRCLWLYGMLLPGVFLGLPALTPRLTAASLLLAFATLCVGHSVGLHRGIIHATYRCGRGTRALGAYLFVLTGLGGPLSWARLHAYRDYWQNRPDCPDYFAYRHGWARDYLWNLHLRFESADDTALNGLPDGIFRDPWLRFLERTWPLHVAAFAWVTAALGGAEAVAVCVCLRVAVGILGHWAIGYASHAHGARPFRRPGATEHGTNNRLLGVISFGEGFHNTHHAFPWSARMGTTRAEWDLGWLVLRLGEACGLVHDLRAWSRDEAATALVTAAHAEAPPVRRGVGRMIRPPTCEKGAAA